MNDFSRKSFVLDRSGQIAGMIFQTRARKAAGRELLESVARNCGFYRDFYGYIFLGCAILL